MAKLTKEMISHGGEISIGPLTFAALAITTLAGGPADASKNGIVTCNERKGFYVQETEGGPLVGYTVSFYVQRDARNEAEEAAVKAAALDQETRAEKRKREDQQKRENEISAARRMTSDTIMDTMRANNLLRNVPTN